MASKPKNRGLGKGLGALFAEQASIVDETEQTVESIHKNSGNTENTVVYIDISSIKPNQHQPRKYFHEDKIEELAQSILEHGIIQPLVVRPSDQDTYEIVAGERRWRAARRAGLQKVPCLIREFSDEENMLVAIIENLQREDLNPIEEAHGLQQMMETYGMTHEEVSRSISKSRPYISNALRLLKLPEEIQDLVASGKISMGHARALINVKSRSLQLELCRRILDEGLSVRDVEKLAAKGNKKKDPKKHVKSADTLAMESRLKDQFGTKVSIDQRGKKGVIKLEYYSSDELNRLLDMLLSE